MMIVKHNGTPSSITWQLSCLQKLEVLSPHKIVKGPFLGLDMANFYVVDLNMKRRLMGRAGSPRDPNTDFL